MRHADTPTFVQPIVCPLLIGRTAILGALQQAIDALRDGQRQTVLVTGEAGIGKSRLVAEMRRYAAARGVLLLQGDCFAQDSACPYAPLLDLLRARLMTQPAATSTASVGPFISELAPLLPDLLPLPPDAPTPPVLDAEQKKRLLFEALVHSLLPRSQQQPMLLIVEDLHWSDEGTLDFLLYLLRRSATAPLLLVATYRSDEVGPRLRHWLAQLDRERLAQEVSLAPLTRDEVAAMLRAIFAQHRPVRAEFLDAVNILAEGNPFYVEELLKSLVVAGDIYYADGVWDCKPLQDLRIPRSLSDAVQSRAARLSPAARDVLVLAAVIGPRFDFALLQQVAQADERHLLGWIKELIAAQLVVEESSERFAFRHALSRQAIYTDLLTRERAALHRTVAETIERIYAATLDAHVADLAYHFFAAGVWARALHYAQRAGERAQALEAPHAAVEQWTRVLHAAHHLDVAPTPHMYRARGRAYDTLGNFEQACADYEEALKVACAAQDGRAEWQALVDLGLLWAGRDYQHTGAYLRRALDLAQTLADPSLQAHSLNRLGNWLLNTGQIAEALQAHHTALALFEAQQDTRSIAATLDLLGMANNLAGDVQACITWYNRAIDLLRTLGDHRGLSSSLAARGVSASPGYSETLVSALWTYEACTGDTAEAQRLARQIGWRAGEAYAERCATIICAGFGDLGKSLAHAHTCLQIAAEIDHQQWQVAAYCALGQIYVLM
ncbi:MAG: AAA family ATPase, partial [Chloroflexota bacterium]|nr:AAA family ATPase [Chloroflexota bacterium]